MEQPYMDPRVLETIQLYEKVIDEVVEYIQNDWVASGNDLRTLEKLKETWRYRTLKTFNIPGLVEPEWISNQKAPQHTGPSMEDVLNSMFGFQQPQKVEEEKEVEEDDGFDDVDDDEMVDLNANDDEPEDRRVVDISSSSENEEEESSTDTDIADLLTEIEANDQLICHYTKRKTIARNTKDEFDLSLLHFKVNGQPFIVKSGKLTARNNKPMKEKIKKKKPNQ